MALNIFPSLFTVAGALHNQLRGRYRHYKPGDMPHFLYIFLGQRKSRKATSLLLLISHLWSQSCNGWIFLNKGILFGVKMHKYFPFCQSWILLKNSREEKKKMRFLRSFPKPCMIYDILKVRLSTDVVTGKHAESMCWICPCINSLKLCSRTKAHTVGRSAKMSTAAEKEAYATGIHQVPLLNLSFCG